MKRTENDRIANRVYVGVCAGSQSVSRPKKRWTDTVKECLKKERFGYQVSKENGVWQGFVGGNAWGVACGMNY